MKIGFDGKRAINNLTGLGNYSRLVIESMAEANGGSDSLLVYAPEMRENPRLEKIRRLMNVEFRFPGPVGFRGALWRSFGISNHLAADGVEIYHGLSNELPLNIRKSGIKSIVTIHDLIYRRLPNCYSLPDRLLYDFKYRRSCENADRIIAISECTKRDIIELYGINPEKIDVIYQGCADIFRQKISDEELARVKAKYGLPGRFVLQVGTIEWRKNLALTAEALAGLEGDVKLVAVGRDRRGYRAEVMARAAKARVADRMLWLGSVDFKDLPALYRLAAVAALPSRYEGFGIPVIEAMECETPFVGATGSCLEEAGGPAGFYVSPDSPEQMAEALRAILAGGDEIRRRIAAGKAYVQKFSTADMAAEIKASYRRALAK